MKSRTREAKPGRRRFRPEVGLKMKQVFTRKRPSSETAAEWVPDSRTVQSERTRASRYHAPLAVSKVARALCATCARVRHHLQRLAAIRRGHFPEFRPARP